jgi:hypothetical protein
LEQDRQEFSATKKSATEDHQGGHFSSGQQLHCRARDRAIQVSQGKGIGRYNGKTRCSSTYQAGLFFTGVMGVRIAWSNPWPLAIEHPNVALPIAISRFKAERGASFHQGPVSSFFFLS